MTASLPVFSNHRERTFWVQAKLRLLGSSFAAIARENSWNRTVVSDAMYRALDAQERAIADKIGVTQQALFPERFDAQGNRLHSVKNSASAHISNVKQAGAS